MNVLCVLAILGWAALCSSASYHKGTTDNHASISKTAEQSPLHAGSKASSKVTSAHAYNKTKHHDYHSPLHKKEEMLGQDTMRIDDAEFKLQSLVSPEFHQARAALNGGKSYNGLEMNTLSPEQVAFIQGTSQWPKYFQPRPSGKPTKRIYPEDPILFPSEMGNSEMGNRRHHGNSDSYRGNDMDETPFKGMSSFGDEMKTLGMAGGPSLSPMFGGTERMQRVRQDSGVIMEERPGYAANQDPSADAAKNIMDEMRSTELQSFAPRDNTAKDEMMNFAGKELPGGELLAPKGILSKYNNPLGGQIDSKLLNQDLAMTSATIYGRPSKSKFTSLFNEDQEVPAGHGIGKPMGILGNILKASKSMPDPERFMNKPSQGNWFDSGSLSRRGKLEKAHNADKLKTESKKNNIKVELESQSKANKRS